MSYDLQFDCGPLPASHRIAGGTFALGGSTEPWINITYNYVRHFREALGDGGIRSLYGKTAEEIIPILDLAIPKLGTDRSADYWEATAGNAGAALSDLRELCRLVPPTAVLEGD